MLGNRFGTCKTLADLYAVFNNEDVVDYTNLTQDELERVALVFEANRPDGIDMPDTPLTEAGYTFVWNVTVDTVETIIKNEEEKVMTGTVKGNVNAAVEEMMGKFAQAKSNIKAQAGETAEEYIERVDDSLNVVKGAFGNVLGILDNGLGYTAFKNSILEVIEAGQYGDSKHDIFKMAKKCRELTEKYIQKVELLGNPDDAQKLKELMEGLNGESIFTMFFSTVYWMGKKVARKLRKWFQVDEEKSVIGAICRSLSGFASILRAGITLIWNTAKFAVSFIAAGVILVADVIVKAITTLVRKVKGWIADRRLEAEDLEEEFEEDEEDLI